MFLFKNRKNRKSQKQFSDIQSVVILEQTQIYEDKQNWGINFGSDGFFDNSAILMDGGTFPAGSIITFSVTYNDGTKEIIKETSGTNRCDKLLQMALDPNLEKEVLSNDEKYTPITLRKNQLPAGNYIIGKDIPKGIYDFTWIFGSGMILKFRDEHDTTLGANTYFQHMGTQYDYQFRQCLNVDCANGELLKIDGNIVVEISKSKKVEIDL